MSGNNFFVDTNILIYLLKGDNTLSELLYNKRLFISFISELELLSYPVDKAESKKIKSLLKDCQIVELNEDIKHLTIELRKQYKLKLPDAIVVASSVYSNSPLITADKGFKKLSMFDIVIYDV